MKNRSLTTFEVIAILEGVSYLLLLGVAMPLKYLGGLPLATRVAGLLHGLAFSAYAVQVFEARATRQWPTQTAWLGLLAGLLPAGTFLFVARLRRWGPALGRPTP
jgi:integral membrane protein